MANIVSLALDPRIQTSCVGREYNPYTSHLCISLPSNYFTQRMREREQGIVHPVPEHVCLRMCFSEDCMDLFDKISNECNQINDDSVNVVIQPPIKKHRKILRPDCADKDDALRIKHDQIVAIQNEALNELGVRLGLELGEYTTPWDWLMDGDEYMDYDRCNIQIFCSKGSDLYKAIIESGLPIY